jgi:toxin ParE1/3/4
VTVLDSAAGHYRSEADVTFAVRFLDAVQRATRRVSHNPHVGTLRFAYELDIPELRSISLDRFPYLVFYVECDDHVDVWRVLRTRRDIPSRLFSDPEESTHRAGPAIVHPIETLDLGWRPRSPG